MPVEVLHQHAFLFAEMESDTPFAPASFQDLNDLPAGLYAFIPDADVYFFLPVRFRLEYIMRFSPAFEYAVADYRTVIRCADGFASVTDFRETILVDGIIEQVGFFFGKFKSGNGAVIIDTNQQVAPAGIGKGDNLLDDFFRKPDFSFKFQEIVFACLHHSLYFPEIHALPLVVLLGNNRTFYTF